MPRAGSKQLTVRLTRKAARKLRGARGLTLTLRVTATDAAGNSASRSVKLRRARSALSGPSGTYSRPRLQRLRSRPVVVEQIVVANRLPHVVGIDAPVAQHALAAILGVDHPQVVDVEVGLRIVPVGGRPGGPVGVNPAVVEPVSAVGAEQAGLALLPQMPSTRKRSGPSQSSRNQTQSARCPSRLGPGDLLVRRARESCARAARPRLCPGASPHHASRQPRSARGGCGRPRARPGLRRHAHELEHQRMVPNEIGRAIGGAVVKRDEPSTCDARFSSSPGMKRASSRKDTSARTRARPRRATRGAGWRSGCRGRGEPVEGAANATPIL